MEATKNNNKAKLLTIIIFMFIVCFSFVFVGCDFGDKNNKPNNENQEQQQEQTEQQDELTVSKMLKTSSKTLYNILNKRLPVRAEDLPTNVWWTIKYSSETKITELNARYIKQKNETTGIVYNFNLTKDLTPDEIINNKPSFRGSSFSSSDQMAYSIVKNTQNMPIFEEAYKRFNEQLNINQQDILFTLVNEISLPKDPTNTMFVMVVQTKLNRIKFDITLPKQENFENYITNIQNLEATDVVLGQIKIASFGQAFIDANSTNQVVEEK